MNIHSANVSLAKPVPAVRQSKANAEEIKFATGKSELGTVLVARSAADVTGATNLGLEVEPKLLELLHDAVPTAKIIGLLVNPTNFNTETLSRSLQPAARTFGLQLHVLNASTERDFDSAFATLRQLRADGLVIVEDVFFATQSRQLAALASRHAVPAIFHEREFTAAGGLMSYTGSVPEEYRQAGVYTGRILKGEKPNLS